MIGMEIDHALLGGCATQQDRGGRAPAPEGHGINPGGRDVLGEEVAFDLQDVNGFGGMVEFGVEGGLLLYFQFLITQG